MRAPPPLNRSGYLLCLTLSIRTLAFTVSRIARVAPSSKHRLGSMAAPTLDTRDLASTRVVRYCDIGANLLDERFLHGTYRGTVRHEPDIPHVLERAHRAGVRRIVLTAGTVEESRLAVQTARRWNARQCRDSGDTAHDTIRFGCTVGVHPTRCRQVFEPPHESDKTSTLADALLEELYEICRDGMTDQTVVAVGEIGLDYDRLDFCPADIQQTYLIRQLECVAARTGLPLFLHNRSVGDDLYHILNKHRHCWQSTDGTKRSGGVVHSFDDSTELALKFINDLGLYIGLNGCSLRTPENLQTVTQLPLDRILLETDCPYCDVRSTHAGYEHVQTRFPAVAEKKFVAGQCVKNRQEPCHIVQVAEIVAGVQNVPLTHVADACYENSKRLFGWDD